MPLVPTPLGVGAGEARAGLLDESERTRDMGKRYFDLKLAGGQVVTWTGEDNLDAARDYVASHPGACVVATRLTSSPVTVLGRAVIID